MGGQPCAQCAQKSPVGTGMLAPIAGRVGVGALLPCATTAGNAKGARGVGALLPCATTAGNAKGARGVGALLLCAATAGKARGASVGTLLHGAQSAGAGLL